MKWVGLGAYDSCAPVKARTGTVRLTSPSLVVSVRVVVVPVSGGRSRLHEHEVVGAGLGRCVPPAGMTMPPALGYICIAPVSVFTVVVQARPCRPRGCSRR